MAGDSPMLGEILVLLAAAVLTVALFRRLRLPPILAYLVVGVAVGPHGLAWISNTEDTRFIAEFGVVFLLFTVGLEFSLPQLAAMRWQVLGLGGAQVLVTTLMLALIGKGLGLSMSAAIITGGVLAMSSTAIVVKQLTERLELTQPHGRDALGILLFQDMAVLPFLIVIPFLGGAGGNLISGLIVTTLKATAVITAILLAGYWLLRPLLHEIAMSRSAELFTLATLLFALTAAAATHAAGLSLAAGGFLAGMMLGETQFRHQIESDIRPFRDVLLGLFFVTVGMELDLHRLPSIYPWVLAAAAGLILFKAALITAIGRIAGSPLATAARTGVVLAHGGEFGFAIISVALGFGILPEVPTQIVIAAVFLTMAATPFLIEKNGAIVRTLFNRSLRLTKAETTRQVVDSARYMRGHVIICGYGRIGQTVARFVEKEGFQYLALDLDPVRVRDARTGGEPVTFGDAGNRDILNAAGLERARLVAITIDSSLAALKITRHVRDMHGAIPIVVRTRDDYNLEQLQHAGATQVVPETLEASLLLASHILMLLGVAPARITHDLHHVRATGYEMLHAFFHGQDARADEEGGVFRERLHTVLLPSGAWAVDRPLQDAGLRDIGVVVTAVRRGGIRGEQPQPEMILRADDALVLYGDPEQLDKAEVRLLRG